MLYTILEKINKLKPLMLKINSCNLDEDEITIYGNDKDKLILKKKLFYFRKIEEELYIAFNCFLCEFTHDYDPILFLTTKDKTIVRRNRTDLTPQKLIEKIEEMYIQTKDELNKDLEKKRQEELALEQFGKELSERK